MLVICEKALVEFPTISNAFDYLLKIPSNQERP